MRKFAALTLLAIYLNAAAQMLLPWVSDIIAHTFNWHDHLEQVHHGHLHSHHVGEELSMAGEDNTTNPENPASAQYFKDLLPAHLIAGHTLLCMDQTCNPLLPLVALDFFYKNITAEVLQPPPNA